jgi:hypothetical protein
LLACYLVNDHQVGYTSQYGRSVMEATIAARQEWGHLPADLSRYDVFAAVADCGRIGDEFLINYAGEWSLGVVSDCAGNDGTPQWMEENRIISEVDAVTAERWGIVGRGGIPVQMAYIHCQIVPGSMGAVAV